jgi:hypothetical protein
MSSFLSFPSDIKTVVWNSTFKTILRKLEASSADNRTAARVLEENPIAGPIGGLDLRSFTRNDLLDFIRFLAELRNDASTITEGWRFPEQVRQFPVDLDSTIEVASRAVAATE